MPSRPQAAWLAGATAALLSAGAAAADEPALSLAALYTADVSGVTSGVRPRAGRYLDNLDLTADLDLEKAVGWRGATLHAYALNNSGGAPNDVAGTLQGVDNIEVATPRLRLFELWLEQGVGQASVRAGLYNLNSEFYANESAGLLLNPSFGIGSELAATGPNGPSIFPSTSLGVRVNMDLGEGRYARAAVLNAKSGVLGDPGGVDWSFGNGVLTIAEAGIEGPTRISIGAWRYTDRQDDIRSLDRAGDPVRRRAQGAYVLGEQRMFGSEDTTEGHVFLRVGVSDGATTPFRGGWQAGVLIARPLASRPDSQLSFGLQQGVLDRKFRDNLRDAGGKPARAESGVELTYSDKLTRRITLQPDLQWIHHAGGDRDSKDRVIAALRLKIDLSPSPAE
ncbi:MAG: carbohydrate porin [Alphaproteobacteria bacterium]|nr:carbohydrate porin [Alphaproteobacteria bacterium]MBU1515831.1 carbohydrate porin [Alphaproteobacteria bacterium]MBU2094053.1 carbohydrate porin [Alphaproteobacteria bacterium]MBU2151405.1 carbohydrate porin [Alphaproteobacteria bacterium]MBU2305319.1 carbohydrate porin [Alphaproteobacteria bacterium]